MPPNYSTWPDGNYQAKGHNKHIECSWDICSTTYRGMIMVFTSGQLIHCLEPLISRLTFLDYSGLPRSLSPFDGNGVGESVVGPTTFATVWELLLQLFSRFVGHLLGGSMIGLKATFFKKSSHMQHLLGLLQPEPWSPWWPLLIHASAGEIN